MVTHLICDGIVIVYPSVFKTLLFDKILQHYSINLAPGG